MTAMCNSLAARLHEPEFRSGVEWLLGKLEGDASRLPTAMCNSLAARLHEPEFRSGVEWLLGKLEGDASRLPTAMCNSLAARLHEPEFRLGVEWLLGKLGNDASRLPTAMCDGLAARLKDAGFRRDLECMLDDTDCIPVLLQLTNVSPFVGHIPNLARRYISLDACGRRQNEEAVCRIVQGQAQTSRRMANLRMSKNCGVAEA
jgi:hypothetical protein